MNDMTNVANALGSYIPGSYPQFMVSVDLYPKDDTARQFQYTGTWSRDARHGNSCWFVHSFVFLLLIQVLQGTTRIGNESEKSVADAESRVHGYPNLWVGGNGCLPDATATNPTRTSVRIIIIYYLL